MDNLTLRNITNDFQDVRLVSLSSWRQAKEFIPCDRGGPYVALQEGYDPEDLTLSAEEFIIGRSGKWLSLGLFFRLPVPERRAEFVFGTAAEVMRMMYDLPSKVVITRPGTEAKGAADIPEEDEMAAAFRTKSKAL